MEKNKAGKDTRRARLWGNQAGTRDKVAHEQKPKAI